MPKCDWCGTKFNKSEATEIFESEYAFYAYNNFHKCLCGPCAIQAIAEEVSGVYYETCEECGKTFDYIEDSAEFENQVDGTVLIDYWNPHILCCECAMKEI